MPPKQTRSAALKAHILKRPLGFVAEVYSDLTMALILPVTVTILIVVWGVHNLSPIYAARDESPLYLPAEEQGGGSAGEKLGASLINALVVIGMVAGVTIIMVLLYKYRCMKVIAGWFILSTALILFFLGWIWLDLVCVRYQIPYDFVTIGVILWNFGIVGLATLFYFGNEKLAQAYLVAISVIMAWVLSRLPEWSTWTILIFIAIYDIVAVLCPKGPLKVLVEESQKRQEPIPGFIYDSTPGGGDSLPQESAQKQPGQGEQRQSQRQQQVAQQKPKQQNAREESRENPLSIDTESPDSERQAHTPPEAKSRTNAHREVRRKDEPGNVSNEEEEEEEEVPNPFEIAGHVTYFKLGLGDFIFYSLLVARAAAYSYISWIVCTISVLMGLVGTLLSLLFLRGKVPALPALPISIFLGALMYFATRFAIAPFSYFMATAAVV